jgi:hypothetical protein
VIAGEGTRNGILDEPSGCRFSLVVNGGDKVASLDIQHAQDFNDLNN